MAGYEIGNRIRGRARRFVSLAVIVVAAGISFAESPAPATPVTAQDKPIVTFIELGSVNCVPCKAMQPVMRSVEKKYGGRVKVVFHDVWTKEGKPFAATYKIRVIPTQVFLDADGKEYFRHEGYFPLEEVEAALREGGAAE